MCAYCFTGDRFFRFDPPWRPTDYPMWPNTVPTPALPFGPGYSPWDLAKLKEYLEILKQIKALEEQVGCLSEPNKADYIGLLQERIDVLKGKL